MNVKEIGFAGLAVAGAFAFSTAVTTLQEKGELPNPFFKNPFNAISFGGADTQTYSGIRVRYSTDSDNEQNGGPGPYEPHNHPGGGPDTPDM